MEEGDSQVHDGAYDLHSRSESNVQFNPPRFSTIMSERDSNLRSNTSKDGNAFFLPKSFSQAVHG